MIILLDLNYTLVSNSTDTCKLRFPDRLEQEQYRQWLVELIRPHFVILITARPDRHRETTLENIERKTNWKPRFAFFNDKNWSPPAFKQSVLFEHLYQRVCKEYSHEDYFAIESNPKTRAMYARHGIRALPVPEGGAVWTALP